MEEENAGRGKGGGGGRHVSSRARAHATMPGIVSPAGMNFPVLIALGACRACRNRSTRSDQITHTHLQTHT